MSSPRIRRLALDYETLVRRFDGWPVIRLVGRHGQPPEHYRFALTVKGLAVAPGGDIVEREEHLVEAFRRVQIAFEEGCLAPRAHRRQPQVSIFTWIRPSRMARWNAR